MDNQLVQSLISKFPTFDPQWDKDARDAWFDGYCRLLTIVENTPGLIAGAGQAVPPAPEPAPAARSNGHGPGHATPVTPEQHATMRRLAAERAGDRAAAEATGLPVSTVNYYMRQYRREAGTARKSPGFRRRDQAAEIHADPA